nr:hypothetical protein [Tanacetum cinerariifolium]
MATGLVPVGLRLDNAAAGKLAVYTCKNVLTQQLTRNGEHIGALKKGFGKCQGNNWFSLRAQRSEARQPFLGSPGQPNEVEKGIRFEAGAVPATVRATSGWAPHATASTGCHLGSQRCGKAAHPAAQARRPARALTRFSARGGRAENGNVRPRQALGLTQAPLPASASA